MKKFSRIFVCTLFILISGSFTRSTAQTSGHNIIPVPVSYTGGKGSFAISSKTLVQISPSSKELAKVAELLNDRIGHYGLQELKISTNAGNVAAKNTIWLSIGNYGNQIGNEGYLLEINRKSISIKANTANGVFYGLQSLLQLMPSVPENSGASKSKTIKINSCSITDYPRFSYRGMHLDVGRHMFPVEFIKKYIDLMSIYKINNFHWHLTEDQGWRLEIKKYPLLTEVGAWRKSTPIGRNSGDDNIFYGGFYTQDEARDIVNYASSRYVTVIPEIEMPGHAMAALAAYPHLSCTGGPFEVWTKWGVNENIFCAGNEEVFGFLEDVLLEVLDIFPSKYIHIGGDEAPKTNWDTCKKCNKRIQDENLKDSHELQNYFITRIEKFLNKHGRQIIGWDEILEGGLAPGATVMSWRGTEGGIAAAKMGHDVVMTPGSHCYFDHYQADPAGEPFGIGGYNTLKNTYSYEPVPEVLTDKESKHILGSQGNVWTEYMKTSDHVEYMAYPRAIALAEVNWSAKQSRNWDDFGRRLTNHLPALDLMKVNYSKSAFSVSYNMIRDEETGALLMELSSDIQNADIRYFTSKNEQISATNRYTKPFKPEQSLTIHAFIDNKGKEPMKITKREILVHDAFGIKPSLNTLYDHRYQANGATSLTDGLRADPNSLIKNWIGYLGADADMILDLNTVKDINQISMGFLHNPGNWIFLPTKVEIKFSVDGVNYFEANGVEPSLITPSEPKNILYTVIGINTKARYIHIIAKNRGLCPKGHPGEGNSAWLFVDEVIVNGNL